MTARALIGRLEVLLVGDEVRISDGTGTVYASVHDARLLQSIGLPAVLPPPAANGLADVCKHQ